MKAAHVRILAMTLPMVIATPLWAQAAPQAAADTAEEATTSEIVVTARRREENISKVPISIAAIGAEQLRERQVRSETDLQSAVPGLVLRQAGSSNQFNYALRGQSVDTYTNSPAGVLPYVNEVQVTTFSSSPLYDLEGIQVLKGPQGTLFGRNTTGGAVLFATKKPGDELEGYVSGRYGRFDSRQLEGAVSIPMGEKAGLRLAGTYVGGGAFVKNLATGQRLGKQDIVSVRGTLKVEPTDAISNITVVQHTDEGGNSAPSSLYSAYGCGSSFGGVTLNSTADCTYGPANPGFAAYLAAHPNLFPGGMAAFARLQRQRGPWTVDTNVPTFHDAKATYAINTTSIELGSGLTIKNIFGYNQAKSDDGFDYDGGPYPIFQIGGTPSADATTIINPQGFIQKIRQISDELQLQGKTLDDKLDFVIGGYYQQQRIDNISNLYAFDFSPVAAGSGFTYAMRSKTRSTAVFGQATYKLTDRFSLTAGGRYAWERIVARQLPQAVFGTTFAPEKQTASKPSWTFSADYQLTPSVLVYVAQRGSWRTGGYNYSVTPLNVTAEFGGNRFNPETTRDVEAGIKYSGRELGVPVTFTAALYNQWVKNVQRAAYVPGVGGTPSLLTANVPKAEITGVEVSGSVRPAPWLSLGMSGAYTDARYTSNIVVLNGAPTAYGPFADAPKWTGSVYADISQELGDGMGKLILHGDVYAQSVTYFSNVAATLAPFTAIKGYHLVNGRLSWANIMESGVTASLYASNLFNKRYWAGGNPVGPTIGLNTAVAGRPRMIGGELRFEF